MGLIHWVCTYAGAYAWAPLSSNCLRERFSLLYRCLRGMPTQGTGHTRFLFARRLQLFYRLPDRFCIKPIQLAAAAAAGAGKLHRSSREATQKQHKNSRQTVQQQHTNSRSSSQAVAAANSFLPTRCCRERLRGAYAKIGLLLGTKGFDRLLTWCKLSGSAEFSLLHR